MGKKNFEREYHRNRLARKYKDYHYLGEDDFTSGVHRDWAEYINGHTYKFMKKVDGKYVTYYRLIHSGPIGKRWRGVYSRGAYPRGMTYEDISSFWEAEEIERRVRHQEGKFWTSKGSIKGHGVSKKYWRTKYNRIRRYKGKKYCHHALMDNLDWADDRIAHAHRPSYLWDIF